jgi:glucokinase
MAVLGPGTGLGVACLVPASPNSVVIASEGGHATMAASSSREDAVIDHLRRQFGHVSAERVVSGLGLENLYRAIIALDRVDVPQRNAAAITKAGLEGNCRIARMALELFCAMLGTIAGNAAPALAAQDRSENVSVGIVHCRFDTPVAPRIMTGCLNDNTIFSRT